MQNALLFEWLEQDSYMICVHNFLVIILEPVGFGIFKSKINWIENKTSKMMMVWAIFSAFELKRNVLSNQINEWAIFGLENFLYGAWNVVDSRTN